MSEFQGIEGNIPIPVLDPFGKAFEGRTIEKLGLGGMALFRGQKAQTIFNRLVQLPTNLTNKTEVAMHKL